MTVAQSIIWPDVVAVVFNTPERPLDPNNPQRFASLGEMTRDDALVKWQEAQTYLEQAKEYELLLRNFCVLATLPADKKEGVNNVALGNGYTAKVGVKYNYTLVAPAGKKDVIEAVDDVIDKFATIDNEGAFIADRLFKWSVDMSLTEYRKLCEDAKESQGKAKLLALVNSILEIKDATPTLEIKAPKGAK